MLRIITILTMLLAVAAIVAPLDAQVAMIDGVPAYSWYRGCGPTAVGMVIGYWDGQGFDDLIPSADSRWSEKVRHMIASTGHDFDYFFYTPDRIGTDEEPLHEDDCVADFMMSSRDPFGQAISVVMYQFRGMSQYANYCGYPLSSGGLVSYGSQNGDELWEVIVREIDAARPVELHVDSDADGVGDHYIVAVGYDITDGARKVGFLLGGNYIFDDVMWAYNVVHWMDFKPFSTEYVLGIGAGVWFNLYNAEDAGWGNGGDISGDGVADSGDIDLLWDYLNAGVYAERADINNDYRLNDYDMHMLVNYLVEVKPAGDISIGTQYGDIDLDGDVDIYDFLILKSNYDQSGGWAEGDIDGSGHINIYDFLLLRKYYGYRKTSL